MLNLFFNCQNSRSGMFMLRNPVIARSPLRRLQQYKGACVSALLHWHAQCHTKWPWGCREFQLSARINPMSLASLLSLLSNEWHAGKKVYDLSHLNHEPIFCMLDCPSQIAQVEYQGQTLYTRVLECKPFINRCYCIGHSLELKYFHFAEQVCTIFCSMLIQASSSS